MSSDGEDKSHFLEVLGVLGAVGHMSSVQSAIVVIKATAKTGLKPVLASS